MSQPKPPEGLVQLSAIPRSRWMGLRVYHPMAQSDDRAAWRLADLPPEDPYRVVMSEPCEGEPAVDVREYVYDEGIVRSWARRGDWAQDEGTSWQEVTFECVGGGSLHYGERNLWVQSPDGRS